MHHASRLFWNSFLLPASFAAGAMLIGCVATVRVAPPPVVYRPPPPPPPVYVAEVQATEPPPPLPDYEQPPPPDDGFLWTPGYWAFGSGGYYWVPGTWVQPPRVGVLWTPGYWGFVGSVYTFHAGYWGPHIGFYGGVNYGFGYSGVGFAGGRWVGNSFAYNRSVTNVTNVTVIHNTYNETVINNVTVNKVSYNGGTGGVNAAATPQERQAAQEPHVAPTPVQNQHIQEAAKNPTLFAKSNGGRPAIAATPRPGVFNAPGVVAAHGAGGAAAHTPTPTQEVPNKESNPVAPPARSAGPATNNVPATQTAGAPKSPPTVAPGALHPNVPNAAGSHPPRTAHHPPQPGNSKAPVKQEKKKPE